jgi:predicted transglutaminase-like cysteine proteinase
MQLFNLSQPRGWPIAILGAAALLAAAGIKPAHADTRYLEAGNRSLPPIGWVQFCQQNADDCALGQSGEAMIARGSAAWAVLRQINDRVNRTVAPVTDEEHWGMVERWSYPTDGAGDCEDYVLEKRHELIAAGVPAGALMIGVVLDKEGLGHAVLVARTSVGDLVLDNQDSRILQWRDTGYTYLKRQDNREPNRWVNLNNRIGTRDAVDVGAATP